MAFFLGPALIASADTANEQVMIVFDGSNSMWGQIDGVSKLEISRAVIGDLLGGWTDDRAVGLMAYGHRFKGDCRDIETLIPPRIGAKAEIVEAINALRPTGKTPLTTAIEMAAQSLSYEDKPTTIVLISDGIESCNRNPCELAESLASKGVRFTTHVVGFGITDAEQGSLACIAEATGGQFFSAADAEQLTIAFEAVSNAVQTNPAPADLPLRVVDLQAPGQVEMGAAFAVTWSGEAEPDDYITIVPAGADDDDVRDHIRTGAGNEGKLTAPGKTGDYEVRYLLNLKRQLVASTVIKVIEPQVTLTVPESVVAGSRFPVSWTRGVNPHDYVTIVPANAEDRRIDAHIRVYEKQEDYLVAPGKPGSYEVRYVLDVDRGTLATAVVEVTEPQVTLTAPESVVAGSRFPVSWTRGVNPHDYVTIVPANAEDRRTDAHIRVYEKQEDYLVAPDRAGQYEIRYLLDVDRSTVASRFIIVTGE